MRQEDAEPNRDIAGAKNDKENQKEVTGLQQEAHVERTEHVSNNGFAAGLTVKPLSFFAAIKSYRLKISALNAMHLYCQTPIPLITI